jgi:hypothetical protein
MRTYTDGVLSDARGASWSAGGASSVGRVPVNASGDPGRTALSPMTSREEILEATLEFGRDFAAGEPREVQRLEFVRHVGGGHVRVVDAHGQDEQCTLRDVARAVDRVTPFAAEVAFKTALRQLCSSL